MKKFKITLALFLTGYPAGVASAATQIIDGNGKLIGANGVVIGSDTFDVSFEDGSCDSIFAGCTANAFQFQDYDAAATAGWALLNQVFLDTQLGRFDSIPSDTKICSFEYSCTALIPYASRDGVFYAAFAYNNKLEQYDQSFGPGQESVYRDYSANEFGGWARFTNVTSAVPEPTTWAMILIGFGGIGAAMRRRKTNARIQFA